MDDVSAAKCDDGLECGACKEGEPHPIVWIVTSARVVEAVTVKELVLSDEVGLLVAKDRVRQGPVTHRQRASHHLLQRKVFCYDGAIEWQNQERVRPEHVQSGRKAACNVSETACLDIRRSFRGHKEDFHSSTLRRNWALSSTTTLRSSGITPSRSRSGVYARTQEHPIPPDSSGGAP